MLRNGETGDWIGTFQGHKGAVWSCVLNDTAQVAATASADFTARVWDATTGDEVHQFQVCACMRACVGESVCVRGRRGRREDGGQGRHTVRAPARAARGHHARPRTPQHTQHKHIVRTCSFARGATVWRLCTGGPEKLLRLFDLERPDAPPVELAAPHSLRCTAWAGDNALLLASYGDKPNVE